MGVEKKRKPLERFFYFFPFQLVLLHLKRNHFLLFFWLILFAFTTQSFANKLGIPYLFLAPEYQGNVGVWSFTILGFSLGTFIMAFNIYSYILHAKRFPFLGTLNRPFLKFCINNSIIPLLFFATYISCSVDFLKTTELLSNTKVLTYMLAFIAGNLLFIVLAAAYFFPTNKNIYKITGTTAEQLEELIRSKRSGIRRPSSFTYRERYKNKWRVDSYLSNPVKVMLARDTEHYEPETLRKVFFQNHVNASFFEVILVVIFLIIGAFQFNSYFVIPAAASACLVFTVILMLISILMSWLKGWTLTFLLAVIILIDQATGTWDILSYRNQVYGLNYTEEPVDYNTSVLDSLNQSLISVSQDKAHHLEILNRWLLKKRQAKNDPTFKPKLILINTSGGGLRSSLWTMKCLQACDSIMNGKLMEETKMITGSSGGTIGAAYYRELHLQRDKLAHNIYSSFFLDNISKDALNRVLFTFATNDIFIRFRNKNLYGSEYTLDRGMTFEDELNKNVDWLLSKRVADYKSEVEIGKIPMMLITPSIVNDGRRLLISSQPLSYLTYLDHEEKEELNLGLENVEFNLLFKERNAENLRMITALRMNSTFPYILPYPTLPTNPPVEVMDAGLRDNFGTKITVRYIKEFRDWISKNTSGIVLIEIRDTEKEIEPKASNYSYLNKFTSPIGSFYGNLFNDQEYNMDQFLELATQTVDVPIHKIPLEIRYSPGEHIALSWHLTKLEKEKIIQSIDRSWNREALMKMETLLND